MKISLQILFSISVFTLASTVIALEPPTEGKLVNGNFKDDKPGEVPTGWKQTYPTGGGLVFNDGKETFLRLASAQPANAGVSQEIKVPAKMTKVEVLGRMRGKPKNEKTEKRAAVEVALRYIDAKGANIHAAVVASENSPNWHTFRREFNLPPGCAKVEVVARSLFAVGTFDFSEIRVEFK